MASPLGPILALFACATLARLETHPSGQAVERTEPEAKAAFLQKILGFVTWPGGGAANAPFKIAFIGRNPVAREFVRLQEAGANGPSPIQVRYESLDGHFDDCQVVFLPSSESKRLQAFAERWAGKPVLTVCESAAGCEKGVVLTLLVSEDRIRYEINLRRAKKAGLVIHSQVLQYAAKVCDGGAQ